MLKHDARCYDDDMRLKIPFLLWLVTIYGIRHGPFIAMTANVISLGLTPYSWLELQTNYYLIACDVPALLVLIAIIYRAPESWKLVRWIWLHGRSLLVCAFVLGMTGFIYLHLNTIANPANPDFIAALGGLLPDIFVIVYLLSSRLVKDIFCEFPENTSEIEAAAQLKAGNSIRLHELALNQARRMELLHTPIVENMIAVQVAQDTNEVMRAAAQCEAAGKMAHAQAMYRELLKRTPDFAPAWHSLGLLAFHAGKVDLAVLMLREAIALDATAALYPRNLGEIYRRMGKLSEAVSLARLAGNLNPQDADARLNLGLALTDAHRLKEAIASYREALKLNPQHASCWNNLGVLLQSTGDREGAMHAYYQAVQFSPDNMEAQKNLQKILGSQAAQHAG